MAEKDTVSTDEVRELFPDMGEKEIAEMAERIERNTKEDVPQDSDEEDGGAAQEEPEDSADEAEGETEEVAEGGDTEEESEEEPAADEVPSGAKSADPPAEEPVESTKAKPSGVDQEKERMREALRLLGYEDTDGEKGWETATAEMKGISVEDLRKQIGASAPESESVATADTAAATSENPEFAAVEKAELAALKEAFPQLANVTRLQDIPNFGKFAQERYNNKSVVEAYATVSGEMPKRAVTTTKTGKEHLHSSAAKGAAAPKGMSRGEMQMARDLFGDSISDKEIADLYRRATK